MVEFNTSAKNIDNQEEVFEAFLCHSSEQSVASTSPKSQKQELSNCKCSDGLLLRGINVSTAFQNKTNTVLD